MAGLELLKRAQERLQVELKSVATRNPSILEMPTPWDDHQGQQLVWHGASLSLEDNLCVLQKTELDK